METWDEIRRWRRARREELIGARQALPQRERQELQARIVAVLETRFSDLTGELIGFYWPIRGEIGLHPLIRRLVEQGSTTLPPRLTQRTELILGTAQIDLPKPSTPRVAHSRVPYPLTDRALRQSVAFSV